MDIPGPQASTSLTIPKTLSFGKKGQILHGQAREIVAHVINFMKSEAEHLKTNEQPEIPFQNFKERTRTATGISERMYKRVLKECKQLETGELSPLPTTTRKRKLPLQVNHEQQLVAGENTEEVVCKQEEFEFVEDSITIKHEPLEYYPNENNGVFDEKALKIKDEPVENDESEYFPPEKLFLTVKKENTDFD